MTDTTLRHRIARLERDHDISPEAFRVTTVGLACLGYAYAIGWLVLFAVCLIAGIRSLLAEEFFTSAITLLLALSGGWMAYPLMTTPRALRRATPRNELTSGHLLQEGDAHRLFELIHKVRRKLKAPRLDEVLITEAFELHIDLVPKNGIFGPYLRTLRIGLPLLEVLSRREFAALLAREYGQISGAAGLMRKAVREAHTGWQMVMGQLHNAPPNAASSEPSVLGKARRSPPHLFLCWFFPRFSAHAGVLGRFSEFRVDRATCRIVGRRTLSDALIAFQLRGRFMQERYWPQLWTLAERQPTPPFRPYAAMHTGLNAGLSDELARVWLKETLDAHARIGETTPNLRDRLLALGVIPELPLPSKNGAAQTLLGAAHLTLQKAFDDRWLAENGENWAQRYRTAQGQTSAIQHASEQTDRPELASLEFK